ncbi:M1 family metallopeptidase [Ulvibacterium marinum]|uniref:Peptidase M1 membrane alanine aminopeptidase domain-containing protein n=1 Tax=Ulvibacterium marinum TaxID=2419782 RepID=A0A3B0C545_9FLAO|nr:M1 family aminopeptidase [Ulvibacterium marinum]RKN79698.1 hypothetical protein D7Z94_15525 [Ulvibacterium marinum]
MVRRNTDGHGSGRTDNMNEIIITYTFAMKSHITYLLTAASFFVLFKSAGQVSIDSIAMEPHAKNGWGWKIDNLDMEITFAPDEEMVRITGKITLELQEENSLGPTLAILGSNGKSMKFDQVSSKGAASIILNQQNDEIPDVTLAHIRFAMPFERGRSITVSFSVSGNPTDTCCFDINEDGAIGSWNNAWHPIPLFDVKGEVSLAKASISTGKSTFYLPREWHAMTEGELTETHESGNIRIEVFQTSIPLARSFVAGPYDITTRKGISIFKVAQEGSDPEELLETASEIFSELERKWGSIEREGYSIVEVPNTLGTSTWGGSSQQGMFWARPRTFAENQIAVFAHEIGHLWWGNMVTTAGDGFLLLNEGIVHAEACTFMETILDKEAASHLRRFGGHGVNNLHTANGYFKLWRENKDMAISEIPSNHDENAKDLVWSKGQWFFHMLRYKIGNRAFYGTMASIFDEHRDKILTLQAFRDTFIETVPEHDLEQFFGQWLDQTGAPILSHDFRIADDETVVVSIVQTQTGKPYHLDLDIRFIANDQEIGIHTVRLTKKAQTFEFKLNKAPEGIELDPLHKLLIWMPEYGENPIEP